MEYNAELFVLDIIVTLIPFGLGGFHFYFYFGRFYTKLRDMKPPPPHQSFYLSFVLYFIELLFTDLRKQENS